MQSFQKKTVPRIVIHLFLDNLLRISAITLAYTQRFRLFAKKVRQELTNPSRLINHSIGRI